MRATARLCGISINTVVKMVCDAGEACTRYMDKAFRNLSCERLQADEVWSFIGAKEKNATPENRTAKGHGDCWTWTAIDADTKLIPAWYVGTRDAMAAYRFMNDLASRLSNRVQLTTDGHRAYLQAVEDAFGDGIDYAMLVKIYGPSAEGASVRYSPAPCTGASKNVVCGQPEKEHVSTSFVERANLTIRMGNRRFTRLTNAFSKKLTNHKHSVALTLMHYNFCRIHSSLRCTPAMEAGISAKVWELSDIVALIDQMEMEKAA